MADGRGRRILISMDGPNSGRSSLTLAYQGVSHICKKKNNTHRLIERKLGTPDRTHVYGVHRTHGSCKCSAENVSSEQHM